MVYQTDRIQVPFQIEDDPIHWLIGVKCRKITHGYCTLEIVTGLQKFKLHTGYIAHKTTRTAKARAIQIQIKSII